jgi:hypothetical protein
VTNGKAEKIKNTGRQVKGECAMLNMKDVYIAKERYEDIRRTAEKHNVAARIEAKERDMRSVGNRSTKIWERVRKALR